MGGVCLSDFSAHAVTYRLFYLSPDVALEPTPSLPSSHLVAISPVRLSPSSDLTDQASPASSIPLVVDLDGTLTPADTLAESVVLLVKATPFAALMLPIWLLRGRAHLKGRVADRGAWSSEHLPLNEPFIAYLRDEHARGRRLILATAAHQRIAHDVAQRLGIFETVVCTDGVRNVKGHEKVAAIREVIGDEFDYAGDSAADLPVWAAARGAVLVGTSARVAAEARKSSRVDREFARPRAGWPVWFRTLRAHQWLKNTLLFIPLLTSFSFLAPSSVLASVTGVIAFSLAASATYIFNDLWDLGSDRAHPRKRRRPLASGEISIVAAVALSAGLLATALALATTLPRLFLWLLLTYLALTITYSWTLKRRAVLDVVTLSALYTLRIMAGAAAIQVLVSTWLLAFSIFVFFSLAVMKRCAELVMLQQAGRTETTGRDYRVSDLSVLWPLGVAAGMSSVVVFGLFINTPEIHARYAHPELLWFAGVALIYWIAHLWIATSRGEMHDDPLVYAVRNAASRAAIIGIVAITLTAYFVRL